MTNRYRWRFASDAVRAELGETPETMLETGDEVKSNPVRRVVRAGGYFLKCDRRGAGRFRREWRGAELLRKSGIPVVEYLACGDSPNGGCLITRALPESESVGAYYWRKFVRGGENPEPFLNRFAPFVRKILESGLFHPDFHIGNILYALFIHRFSNRALAIWTALMGIGLGFFTLTDFSGYGNLGVGWTLDATNFIGGLLRMLFPFSLGMLVFRHFKPAKIRGAFWICSLILFVLFHVPFIPGLAPICYNGLFEMICITLAFPLLVWLGASGSTTDRFSSGVCKFLGDISFPVYIIHYPLYYLFYAWLIKNQYYTFGQTWVTAILLIAGNIVLAWCCLKIYDEPVRRYLSKRFLNRKIK